VAVSQIPLPPPKAMEHAALAPRDGGFGRTPISIRAVPRHAASTSTAAQCRSDCPQLASPSHRTVLGMARARPRAASQRTPSPVPARKRTVAGKTSAPFHDRPGSARSRALARGQGGHSLGARVIKCGRLAIQSSAAVAPVKGAPAHLNPDLTGVVTHCNVAVARWWMMLRPRARRAALR
jgi:hypothetical protein